MSPPSEKAEPVRGCTRDQHLQTPTARPPAAAAGMYVPNTAVMGAGSLPLARTHSLQGQRMLGAEGREEKVLNL